MEEALFQKYKIMNMKNGQKLYIVKEKALCNNCCCGCVYSCIWKRDDWSRKYKSYWKVWWDRDDNGDKSSVINVDDMETKQTKDIDEGTSI